MNQRPASKKKAIDADGFVRVVVEKWSVWCVTCVGACFFT